MSCSVAAYNNSINCSKTVQIMPSQLQKKFNNVLTRINSSVKMLRQTLTEYLLIKFPCFIGLDYCPELFNVFCFCTNCKSLSTRASAACPELPCIIVCCSCVRNDYHTKNCLFLLYMTTWFYLMFSVFSQRFQSILSLWLSLTCP